MIKHKCLFFNKDYSNKIDEEFKKGFKDIFQFSNNDINEFIMLLRKVVYPYKYRDVWEKFIKTSLPAKAEFYDNLNMDGITDSNYKHAKEFVKNSK